MATAEITDPTDQADEHTKAPFLRRVRIRGYKSIAFCDVTLEPLTVLVGRNGSGKSNFLDALAFLRDVVDLGATEAVKRHGGWSSVACRSPETPGIEIELEIDLTAPTGDDGKDNPKEGENNPPNNRGRASTATYLLNVSGGIQTSPVVNQEKLVLFDECGLFAGGFEHQGRLESIRHSGPGNAEASLLIWQPGSAVPAFSATNGMTRHSDKSALVTLGYPLFIGLSKSIRNLGHYSLHPDAIRQLQKPLPGVFLEKDGRNLASVVRALANADPDQMQRVKAYLEYIANDVLDFEAVDYGEYETLRFRVRTQSGREPLAFDAASMSDGTLRALSCLMAAFQDVPPSGRPSLVGIEEPETSLHPAAMRALVDALDEATSETQIIISTHSAELLDNPTIKPANVRVVEMVDGQTLIGPVDDASIEIVAKDLNTLGGLERQNHLEIDFDDRDRQRHLFEQ